MRIRLEWKLVLKKIFPLMYSQFHYGFVCNAHNYIYFKQIQTLRRGKFAYVCICKPHSRARGKEFRVYLCKWNPSMSYVFSREEPVERVERTSWVVVWNQVNSREDTRARLIAKFSKIYNLFIGFFLYSCHPGHILLKIMIIGDNEMKIPKKINNKNLIKAWKPMDSKVNGIR